VLFAYTGSDNRSYPDYADRTTGRMLYTAPGGTYDIRPASNPDLPMPPNDGRWEPAPPPGSAAAMLAELEQRETPAQVQAQLQADLADGENTPRTPESEA